MKIRTASIVAFLACLNLLISCRPENKIKIERAFYYWKSNEYTVSEGEKAILKNAGVQKLYVKFFEVEKDRLFGTKPISKTQFHLWNYLATYNLSSDSFQNKKIPEWNIIPTIFIKNDVFYNASKSSLDTLADNIVFLTNKYFNDKIFNFKDYSEMQIDCDWTIKTKDNYFYLLKALRDISKKKVSVTLRLYPYKYPEIMGVPPVDRATLMCYNLINPLENKKENSIQNNTELEKYLKNTKKYPLHLDIALPVFSWAQVYQNDQFVGIINPSGNEFKLALKRISPLWYSLEKDIEINDMYLREGDKVKIEEVTEKATLETISLLKKYISFDDTSTITLFHLDESNLKKFNNETLNSFYTGFSN